MYREGAHEQENLLKSIKLVDQAMKAGTAYNDRLEFESHIFFDGATRGLVMNDFVLQVRFYLSAAVILSSSGQRCSLDSFHITNVFQHRFLLCWTVSLLLCSQLNSSTLAFSVLRFISFFSLSLFSISLLLSICLFPHRSLRKPSLYHFRHLQRSVSQTRFLRT